MGNLDLAKHHLDMATSQDELPADAQADAAWMMAASGSTDSAWLLLGRAARAAFEGSSDPGANACIQYTRALLCLAAGKVTDAEATLEGAREGSAELDALVQHASLHAMALLAAGRDLEALGVANKGLEVAEAQGASHWELRLRLIASVAASEPDQYRQCLLALLSSAKLSTLVLADVIVSGLFLLQSVPPALDETISAWPDRWLPALRQSVERDGSASAETAAHLLAKYGTLDDVALLSNYERSHVRPSARRVLGRQLARHTNPTLMLHDLGHVSFDIGQRTVSVSLSRRRAASLLAFLATRPGHTASKDLVLESLWPTQTPAGAANSLHQTLFYLRRDINPNFNESHSIHYLVVEPELVYFDPELVQVDSSSFLRQAAAALLGEQLDTLGPALLKDYGASFAPEFEYEDWSMAWRDRVHATYLQLAQRTSEVLLKSGAVQQGIDVIGRALALDPGAMDLEVSLIMALMDSGAAASAAHQYSHFAKAYADEFAAAPPTFADLVARKPDVWPALRRFSKD